MPLECKSTLVLSNKSECAPRREGWGVDGIGRVWLVGCTPNKINPISLGANQSYLGEGIFEYSSACTLNVHSLWVGSSLCILMRLRCCAGGDFPERKWMRELSRGTLVQHNIFTAVDPWCAWCHGIARSSRPLCCVFNQNKAKYAKASANND